tara:strand:+ start:138 stop:380 length:243 start_codon:yes stop_codon:yes gene_type:complete
MTEVQKTNQAEIKEIENNGYTVLYAVMRLNTNVSIQNPFTQEDESIKLANCAGYIPVFDNIEQAEKSADNGKYKIFAIQA